ncbi:hypothetical protein IC744_01835 [Microbacterium hominis]|uniref:hypothetical protein n=1 Tax=Microbacterium hominis TaxID=162426 RepID=UPI00168A8686|nr:hypothetical protein [Microbacterium hominis]QOC25159.1 hypothetical protein IC745_12485 [Microbacterium hominis]QOC29194.1 hypothetical protein IC744_01835 [Microbacterium hominis]
MDTHDDKRPATDDAARSESDAVRKDMTYSPSSEAETERKQNEDVADTLPDDIDKHSVLLPPGTGGPDDSGDVEVDPEDLHLATES